MMRKSHSKQKKIFKGLAIEKMEEIQDLGKQTDFNNLAYHYISKDVLKIYFFKYF